MSSLDLHYHMFAAMNLRNIALCINMMLFTACSNTRKIPVYDADCGNHRLRFSVTEKKQLAYTAYQMEISIGQLPAITVTPQQVIDHTAYDFSILGDHPHYLYNTVQTNAISTEKILKNRMVLFINPAVYSKEDFEQINACLSAHHPQMETQLYEKYIVPQHSFYYLQFAGIVYGLADDFTEIYRNEDGDRQLKICFNGNIQELGKEKQPLPASVNLSLPVAVRLQANHNDKPVFPEQEWATYRNAKNESLMKDDFNFYADDKGVIYAIRKQGLIEAAGN